MKFWKNTTFNPFFSMYPFICFKILEGADRNRNRKSHRSCSIKKCIYNFFFKIDRKTPAQGLSFDKVASTWNFIQKETVRSVFFCEFWGIFKNNFFTERIWVTASVESLIRNKLIESSVVTLTHATLILCFYVKKLDLNKLIPELALSQCTNI